MKHPSLPAMIAASISLAVPSAGRAAATPPPSAEAAPHPASFARFDARARAGERLTVVFFGCSLLWSANASEPSRTGFRGLMADWLEERYPDARFRFVDAAVGGTGSLLGVFRLDRDVLAYHPDLVFLDFVCNDGWDEKNPEGNIPTLCAYESILRRLHARGIPAFHVFFTFKFWAKEILGGSEPEEAHLRLVPYRRLAEAYGNGTGDVYLDCALFPDLRSGKTGLDDVWPIDGGHPDDLGYRYFAEAAQRGFERAVERGLVARLPETPLYGDVADVRRFSPACPEDGAEPALPPGWARKLTYRTSLWYDGLSSRWMGDVAAFSGAARSPLAVRARGNVVGVFGEADEKAVPCDVRVDGEPLAQWRGTHGAGPGRLFIWRSSVLPGWLSDEPAEHEFAFDPVADGTGEFHIGSICTATLLPVRREESAGAPGAADAGGADSAIEAIDHARGGAAENGGTP